MALKIDTKLTPQKLLPAIERMFELSAGKILSIEKTWRPADGTPVFTIKGRYASRGWTEWTQGFQFGSAILQFDATGEERFLDIGRRHTIERMASHVSHVGVHDHGFNNVSTYGNLLRLMHEGRIEWNDREKDFYELALKVSGAVQAARWTRLPSGSGYIYSFNGPHSLFIDTMRSLRSLAIAHQLGHALMAERDCRISLLLRLLQHAHTTAEFNIYAGPRRDGARRDAYDVRGRTAHEAIFNLNDGSFRCPNSQQGYSPFSTWTRGLAWAILGFAEQLEFIAAYTAEEWKAGFGKEPALDEEDGPDRQWMLGPLFRAAFVTAEYYCAICCTDGVPTWDTGAPNLHRFPANYLNQPADPFNEWEPVDSSAAAIAAQGLIRLGNLLLQTAQSEQLALDRWERELTWSWLLLQGTKFETQHQADKLAECDRRELRRGGMKLRQAGLTIVRTLLAEPYLSTSERHQGLLLHSVYHRPNGWDYIAPGQKVPNGESSMWGDYHLRELALLILREAKGLPYLTFFGCAPTPAPQSASPRPVPIALNAKTPRRKGAKGK
jgi:hypothetical protein